MTAGTEYVLVAVVCGALGGLLSIGYNLKRIAVALEALAAAQTHKPVPEKPE